MIYQRRTDYSLDMKTDQICVVENIADMWALESTSVFKGQYHILGGTLSAINGSNPEDLLINLIN